MQTFADYMEQALYGSDGYYSSGTAKSGKTGDYFTAPDVGPIFGRLLAEIFRSWKDKLRVDPFTLIEAGAGEGRLTRDILTVQRFPFVAIERSVSRLNRLKELQKDFPQLDVCPDFEELAKHPREGVLFGNELIDAFPVHRVRMKNRRLEEAYMIGSAISWAPPSTTRLQSYFDRLGITLPEEYETEVNLAMSDWLREAARAFRKGLVVLIDYGRPAWEYYAPERTRGTLRAFSKHKVSANFLGPDGKVDLTADVDFTSLALDARETGLVPLAFMEMGSFLMMGIQGIAGTRPAPPGLKYLLHPEGLGTAFHVLILGKNINSSEWTFEHNRIARLGLGRTAVRPYTSDDPG
jgi:SAM-dependent MidA family methyltransferase